MQLRSPACYCVCVIRLMTGDTFEHGQPDHLSVTDHCCFLPSSSLTHGKSLFGTSMTSPLRMPYTTDAPTRGPTTRAGSSAAAGRSKAAGQCKLVGIQLPHSQQAVMPVCMQATVQQVTSQRTSMQCS